MASTPSSSLGRSVSATKTFLRRRLWIWPVFAALMLATLGWMVRSVVEDAVKTTMADNLRTILDADEAALEIWLKTEEASAKGIAGAERVRELVQQLAELAAADATDAQLVQSDALEQLRGELAPWCEAHGYNGFAVANENGRIIAALRDQPVGKTSLPIQTGLLATVLADNTTVTRPAKSAILLPDQDGVTKAGVPTMFAAAPVKNDEGDIVAVLGLRIRPELDFTRVLSVARAGKSGETYAFDADGLMISESRFDDELKQIGLITDRADSHSILNLEIRDPQGDMTRGYRPRERRSEMPLTRMAAAATAGNDGVDVEGYRDYRGVPVIGAWKWLPRYGFGVATEVDVAEAYRPLYILRAAFWALFGIIVASAVAIFGFTIVVARLNRQARKATVEARRLGQYNLDEKIGAGGMGVVYRARHAMLQRPTAVKLLDVDKTNEQTIARFEREVKLTSQLNHPNTIAVYDYGRTPEGVFYYAMEYLDGLTLEDLVLQFGPQHEGRVISILRQLCGSLGEAHDIGLIHRDVKPANIILNRRGGICDVVKLLDFGLVKAVDAERDSGLTAAGSLNGTPLYLSPEGIERPDEVDARSDLYAVGAVGYFLITGTALFSGQSVVEICMKQVNTKPERPSSRLGRPVSDDLEAVLLKCLAKSPAERPQSAALLVAELDKCQSALAWTQANAESWWTQHSGQSTASLSDSPTDKIDYKETIVHDSNPLT